jgi:flagellar FliL protein
MAVSAVKKEPAKPQAVPATPGAAPDAQPTKKKGKLLYAAIAVAVLSAGGGGTWWSMSRDDGLSPAKAEAAKPPVFAPLENFTVNLAGEDGSQFLQVGLTLRLIDDAAVAALKARMPEVRDRTLLLLSAKKASELLTLEGKRKLSSEIQAAVNAILVPGSAQPGAATGSPAAPATAPAPAASGEPAGEPQAEAAPAAEAPAASQEPAASEPAQAPAAPVLPVTGVLFTSFIIQ